MNNNERIKNLESINTLLYHSHRQGSSPRGELFVVSFVFFVVAICFAKWGADVLGFGFLYALVFGFAGVLALSVGITHDGGSWDQMLEQAVADYDPVDKDGYEALRTMAKEQGHLDREALARWIKSEQERLEERAKHPFIHN